MAETKTGYVYLKLQRPDGSYVDQMNQVSISGKEVVRVEAEIFNKSKSIKRAIENKHIAEATEAEYQAWKSANAPAGASNTLVTSTASSTSMSSSPASTTADDDDDEDDDEDDDDDEEETKPSASKPTAQKPGNKK